MAGTLEVSRLPGELCPDCGSGFARDFEKYWLSTSSGKKAKAW